MGCRASPHQWPVLGSEAQPGATRALRKASRTGRAPPARACASPPIGRCKLRPLRLAAPAPPGPPERPPPRAPPLRPPRLGARCGRQLRAAAAASFSATCPRSRVQMFPSLQRPTLAEKIKLPQCRGKVARHAPWKVPPSDPNELRGSSKSCRNVAGKLPHPPKFRPRLALVFSFGQVRSTMAELGNVDGI